MIFIFTKEKRPSMTEQAPKIEQASWGRIEVEGYEESFKDVKLYPGGARAWDWNETGTRHDPGIQEADLKELLDNGSEQLLLSQGFWKRLKVPEETRKILEDKGVQYEILPTGRAIEAYNRAIESGKAAGALIHSTC